MLSNQTEMVSISSKMIITHLDSAPRYKAAAIQCGSGAAMERRTGWDRTDSTELSTSVP